MRQRVTILGLIELTALIAMTLAIDRVLLQIGHGRIQLNQWLRVVLWSVILWGAICGVYVAWRQIGIQRKVRFVGWSCTWGLLATLINAIVVGCVVANILHRAEPFGYYFDWQRDWSLQAQIIALATLQGCLIGLLLAIFIAIAVRVREKFWKPKDSSA